MINDQLQKIRSAASPEAVRSAASPEAAFCKLTPAQLLLQKQLSVN